MKSTNRVNGPQTQIRSPALRAAYHAAWQLSTTGLFHGRRPEPISHPVKRHADDRRVLVHGHTLMSNHVHLAVTGQEEGGVSRLMQHVTGQYAQYLHGRLNRRGRVWQSRFYSCVLDAHHSRARLRGPQCGPGRHGGKHGEARRGLRLVLGRRPLGLVARRRGGRAAGMAGSGAAASSRVTRGLAGATRAAATPPRDGSPAASHAYGVPARRTGIRGGVGSEVSDPLARSPRGHPPGSRPGRRKLRARCRGTRHSRAERLIPGGRKGWGLRTPLLYGAPAGCRNLL